MASHHPVVSFTDYDPLGNHYVPPILEEQILQPPRKAVRLLDHACDLDHHDFNPVASLSSPRNRVWFPQEPLRRHHFRRALPPSVDRLPLLSHDNWRIYRKR